MKKRAQVTIFIIIGLIILALIFFGVYFRKEIKETLMERAIFKSIVVEENVREAVNYISNCINDVSDLAVTYVLAQGGWIKPRYYFEYYPLLVGYWKYENKDTSPTLETIKKEMEDFVNFYVEECMADFYREKLIIIRVTPETKIEIKPNKIIFDVSYPAIILFNNVTYKVPDTPFHYEKDAELVGVYNAGNKIIDMELKNSNYVDLTYMGDLGYDVTRLPFGRDTLYLITGKTTQLLFATR